MAERKNRAPQVKQAHDLFGNDVTDKVNDELRKKAEKVRRTKRAAEKRAEKKEQKRIHDNKVKVAKDKLNYGKDLWGQELSDEERKEAEKTVKGESVMRNDNVIQLSEGVLRVLISECVKKTVSRFLSEGDSGIHIKEKNKGKFTATKKRTGKSTEELTHSKNPLTRKRAIFAQNARKWAKNRKANEAVDHSHKLFRDAKRYRMEWFSCKDDNSIVCQLAGKPEEYARILRVIADMDLPSEGYKVTGVSVLDAEKWDSTILHYRHYDPSKPVIRITYEYDPDVKAEYDRKHQSI